MSSNLPEGYTDIEVYVKDLEAELKELRAFKEEIINDELLTKKYRVISAYSNYPVEDSIHFYYSPNSFYDSHFTFKDLKKISYLEVEKLYKKDPEFYKWLGHDFNWVCGEGGNGYNEKTFNQTKFNNMVIQHTSIVADYINSNIKLKLSLIK